MPIGNPNIALLFDVNHFPVTRLSRKEKQKSNDLFGLIFGSIITTISGIILAPIGGAAFGALGTSLALSANNYGSVNCNWKSWNWFFNQWIIWCD